MFEVVAIKNFQSHKDTKLKFANGVNVLVGASDQGKSAILRAILWAVNNRPLGTDDIVSHWARDKKGKIEEEMLVQITTENGFVIRRRSENANQYVLARIGEKDVFFNAINKDVPGDIQKFFRLSDVNIQQQHDSPFLLSQSSGDVAKYFNKIVRLDVIDRVLSNAESARRDTNKKIKEYEQERLNLQKQIEGYDWLDQAQALAANLNDNVIARIVSYTADYNALANEIELFIKTKDELKNVPDIKSANALIEKIDGIEIDYAGFENLQIEMEEYKKVNRDRKIFEMVKSGKDILSEIDMYIGDNAVLDVGAKLLQKEMDEYIENKKLSDMGFDKNQVAELIKEIETIKPDYGMLRELNMQVKEYEFAALNKDEAETEKSDLIKQLPDVCPTCGALMRECKE